MIWGMKDILKFSGGKCINCHLKDTCWTKPQLYCCTPNQIEWVFLCGGGVGGDKGGGFQGTKATMKKIIIGISAASPTILIIKTMITYLDNG